jgi:hypothetical protein
MVNRRRWMIEHGQAAVEIDGTLLYDGERSVPAIVLRMHGHLAHHLAHIFADWTTIAELLESGRGTDEDELAEALHEAAEVAGTRQACLCRESVTFIDEDNTGRDTLPPTTGG